METAILCWGYIGIMENIMETTIEGLGIRFYTFFRVQTLGLWAQGSELFGFRDLGRSGFRGLGFRGLGVSGFRGLEIWGFGDGGLEFRIQGVVWVNPPPSNG